MTKYEYYKKIIDKLEKTIYFVDYIVGAGKELIDYGWNPNGILVAVEESDKLRKLSCEWGLQIHTPIVGKNCEYILAPFDFEVSLTNENYKLYESKKSQNDYFKKMVMPLMNYLEKMLIEYKIPFLLDLTPSGGHILFLVKKNTEAWNSLKKIGFLEPDLKAAYKYKSNDDIKRKNGVTEDAGLVFSGIGRIAEYMGLKAKVDLGDSVEYPISFCDALPKSLNYDISWAGDSAYMRSIRTPFSLHKKNIEKYHFIDQGPLVDVIKTEFNGNKITNSKSDDIDFLLDCMWDLELAVKHSENVSGTIPIVNSNICNLVNDYMKSDLYKWHKEFDNSKTLENNVVRNKAVKDKFLSSHSVDMLENPQPSMLQPMQLKIFIKDLLSKEYTAKEIGCLIRDYYQDSNYYWYGIDWFKYPSEPKAFFWARLYSSVINVENGKIKL